MSAGNVDDLQADDAQQEPPQDLVSQESQHDSAPRPLEDATSTGLNDEAPKEMKALMRLIRRTPGEDALEDEEVLDAFRELDGDGSGVVDLTELTAALHQCGIPASDAAMSRVFQEIDKNLSGDIDIEEFRDFFVHMEELNDFEERKRRKQAFIDGMFAVAFVIDLLVCGTILVIFSRTDPQVDPGTYESCYNALQVLGGGLAVLLIKVVLWPFVKLTIIPVVARCLACVCPTYFRIEEKVPPTRLSAKAQSRQMRGQAARNFENSHGLQHDQHGTGVANLPSLELEKLEKAKFAVGTKVLVNCADSEDGAATVLRQSGLTTWTVQLSGGMLLDLPESELQEYKAPEVKLQRRGSIASLMSILEKPEKQGADPQVYQAAAVEQAQWLHNATGRSFGPFNPTRPLASLDRHEQHDWTWGATLTGVPLGSLRAAAAVSGGFGPMGRPAVAWAPQEGSQDEYIAAQLGFGHISAPAHHTTLVDDCHQTWQVCT